MEEMDLMCCAWSQGRRLAIFGTDGYYAIWDGRTLRNMPNWAADTKLDGYSDTAWQCSWSRDDRYIAFRCYGEDGERTFSSATHTSIMNVKSRKAPPCTMDAGCVAWGRSAAFFCRINYQWFGPATLTRVTASTGSQKKLMDNCVAYAVSQDLRTIYSVTNNGDVFASPTNVPKWRLIHRLGTTFSLDTSDDWSLASAPHGFVACIGGVGDES